MSTEKVTVFAKFQAKKGRQGELKSLLLEMAGQSSKDPGCLQYEVLQDKKDDTVFMFLEVWESQAEADNHVKMPYLPPYRERRAPMLAKDLEVSTWITL